jgi:hypothetical protein
MVPAIAEFDSVATAAFLTQTVQLDDATTVKLEIWCVCLAFPSLSLDSQVIRKGYCWSGALQG